MRSFIHCLPTLPATLAMPQSAAVAAGCDRLQPILDTDIAATCTVTNSAGFLTAIKQTGELRSEDSTALLLTTALGRGATSSGSTNSPPVLLGRLPISPGKTTSNPWRKPHETPSLNRTRTNSNRLLRLLSTGDDSAAVLLKMVSESRSDRLYLLSLNVYRPTLV